MWLLQENVDIIRNCLLVGPALIFEVFLVLFDFLTLRTNGVMILGQVVGVLLVGRLGEDSFLPQIGSQIGIGLSNGSVSGLSCKTEIKYKVSEFYKMSVDHMV